MATYARPAARIPGGTVKDVPDRTVAWSPGPPSSAVMFTTTDVAVPNAGGDQEIVGAAGDEQHVGASGDEPFGDAEADALAGARDDGPGAVEPQVACRRVHLWCRIPHDVTVPV